MNEFFKGVSGIYGAYNAQKANAQDYNLSMAKLAHPTPPTQSKSLDTATNNATVAQSNISNRTLLLVGGGVVGVVLLVSILKK